MTKPETPYGNSSTGDIDDPSPPPTRPAAPHHTNATLTTPNGTHLAPSSTTTEESSPTKPPPPPTTNKTLLATACAHLLATAPQLRPVITQHPCPIFSPSGLAEPIDPFRSLTSGIIAQQVSGAAAKTIQHRFIALFPAAHCPGGFPPPALVAAADLPTLRSAGLSQRKAEYIHGLAAQFVSGAISAPWLMTAEDREVRERLGSVRGLGAWSVDMFMCFGLKRMDVFSVGDLGVQRGMAAFVGRDVAKLKARGGGKWKYMSEKEMVEVSERFRPYR
jgi:DNA-3-methyladenine glycosylase II